MATPRLPHARFWAKVDKTETCWLWTGTVDRDGYGRVRIDKHRRSTHRHAWIITHRPISAEVCVCHKCDVPTCVRPDHLFIGTHADNVADRGRKGRTAITWGESNGSAKLTAAQVREIRALRGSKSQRVMGLIYGVTQSTIKDIQLGRTWRLLE